MRRRWKARISPRGSQAEYRPAHATISRLRSRCGEWEPSSIQYHRAEISDIERVVFRQRRHRKIVPRHRIERDEGTGRAIRARVWAIVVPNIIDQIAGRTRLMIAVTHDEDGFVREAAVVLVHEEV